MAKASKAQRQAAISTTLSTPQSTVAPATKTPVEGTEKKARKLSGTYLKYREVEAFKPEQVITVVVPASDGPKRKAAQTRYELYKSGMTVGQYIEASKKAGNSASLASNDIRWDMVKGFISVK